MGKAALKEAEKFLDEWTLQEWVRKQNLEKRNCPIEWSSVEPTREESECCTRGGTGANLATSQTETPVAVVAALETAVAHQIWYNSSSGTRSSS
jgi:hypothetical protein